MKNYPSRFFFVIEFCEICEICAWNPWLNCYMHGYKMFWVKMFLSRWLSDLTVFLYFFYNYLFRVLNTSWHSRNFVLLKIFFILKTCQLKNCDWKIICYGYRKVAIKILFWAFFPETECCPHGVKVLKILSGP